MPDLPYRFIRWTVLAACAAAMLLHVLGTQRDFVQLDEFEHLHAAWLVSHGQTPYADFFEHHTPLFYFLGAPFLSLAKPGFDTILNMRLLALGFSVSMAAAGWLWLRRYGRIHGLMAVGLMAASTTVLDVGHTIFLDTFSAPLLVLSAMLMAGGERKPGWMLGSGICFGLAVLFNIKASMAVFAPIVLMASRGWAVRIDPERRRAWASEIGAYLAGGLVSIALVAALLGKDGLEGMWRYTVEMNLGWKARHSGMPRLLAVLRADALVSFSAAALIAYRVWTLRRRRFVLEERDAPWLFLASAVAGVFVLPVVWYEYFAMLAPFLALTGAMALGEWFSAWDRASAAGSGPGRYSVHALAFFALVAVFPFRAFLRADPWAYTQSAIMLGLGGVLMLIAWRAVPGKSWLATGMSLTLAVIVPLARNATKRAELDNGEQRKRVEYVLANTGPDESVFDGYTGHGLFRPHAYFFWFLHQEVQAMLPESDKGARLIAALEASRPAMAIADNWVAALPQEVQAYLANHYEGTTPFAELKKRRRTNAGLMRPIEAKPD
jgi:4-amino-4-deoxy-L-arabinose transferase-like glycosyltransferase